MDSRILIGGVIAVILVAVTGWYVARNEPDAGRGASTNRRALIRLGAVLGLGLAGLAARLVSITVTNADQTTDRRGISPDDEVLSNPRLISQQLTAKRGRILDRNGEQLAYSETGRDGAVRVFPVPEAAHVLGYFSPLRFGTAGIEDSRNGTLTGTEPLTLRESLEVGLLARHLPGHDVRLTIDLQLQRLAASLLQGSSGSAVLLDHRTGRILAMASSPAYDPASLNAANEEQIASADQAWNDLGEDDQHP